MEDDIELAVEDSHPHKVMICWVASLSFEKRKFREEMFQKR